MLELGNLSCWVLVVAERHLPLHLLLEGFGPRCVGLVAGLVDPVLGTLSFAFWQRLDHQVCLHKGTVSLGRCQVRVVRLGDSKNLAGLVFTDGTVERIDRFVECLQLRHHLLGQGQLRGRASLDAQCVDQPLAIGASLNCGEQLNRLTHQVAVLPGVWLAILAHAACKHTSSQPIGVVLNKLLVLLNAKRPSGISEHLRLIGLGTGLVKLWRHEVTDCACLAS